MRIDPQFHSHVGTVFNFKAYIMLNTKEPIPVHTSSATLHLRNYHSSHKSVWFSLHLGGAYSVVWRNQTLAHATVWPSQTKRGCELTGTFHPPKVPTVIHSCAQATPLGVEDCGRVGETPLHITCKPTSPLVQPTYSNGLLQACAR